MRLLQPPLRTQGHSAEVSPTVIILHDAYTDLSRHMDTHVTAKTVRYHRPATGTSPDLPLTCI